MTDAAQPARRLAHWGHSTADAYRSDTDEDRPLGGYVGALGVFGTALAGLTAAAGLTGRSGPDRVSPWDVAVLGVATHKAARLLAKDAVTSPLRAPFVRYEDASGDAEVAEEVRHHGGAGHAVGEMITCPFCLAPWVATTFVAGTVFLPRFTRLVTWVMSGVAVSDFLQLGYAAAQQLAEG